MTKECISITFDPRDMLLTLQIGFSFLKKTAVACELLERLSGFKRSSEATAPRYLNFVTVPSCCSNTLISLWMSLTLFVISLVFSTLVSILYHVQVLSRLSTRASSSCSCSARTSMPSAKGWLGGAMVLGKLPVPGRPTYLDCSRVRAYCACSRCEWGLFGHFFSRQSFLFFLPLSGRRPDID